MTDNQRPVTTAAVAMATTEHRRSDDCIRGICIQQNPPPSCTGNTSKHRQCCLMHVQEICLLGQKLWVLISPINSDKSEKLHRVADGGGLYTVPFQHAGFATATVPQSHASHTN